MNHAEKTAWSEEVFDLKQERDKAIVELKELQAKHDALTEKFNEYVIVHTIQLKGTAGKNAFDTIALLDIENKLFKEKFESIREMFAPQILTQDNLATHLPVYQVQQLDRIYGMDPMYGEDDWHWMYMCDDFGRVDNEDMDEIQRCLDNDEDVPEEFEKLYYIDRWNVVQSFFTMDAAERYMESNSHNLKEPRIYVASGYRNKEWAFIRDLLTWVAERGGDEYHVG